MGQARLKGSFIYLANAVNDLAGNWVTIGLVLAPLVAAGSLCLLPDALNLQHELAETFLPGAQNIRFLPVQTPYPPLSETNVPPLFPWWMTTMLHLLFLLITLTVSLAVLYMLKRWRAGAHRTRPLNEVVDVYRRGFGLLPAFFWVALLQAFVTAVLVSPGVVTSLFARDAQLELVPKLIARAIGSTLLIVPGLLALIWLYFARTALVFDDRHSWSALLYSRDLTRGRFFRVAVRIVVFSAVFSGYASWAGGFFVGVSLLLTAIGAVAGFLWAGVFLADVLSVGAFYATVAFFIAAGVRLYHDLVEVAAQEAASRVTLPPTAPLRASASG